MTPAHHLSSARRPLALVAAALLLVVLTAGPLRPTAVDAQASTPTVETVPNTFDAGRTIPTGFKQTCIIGPGSTTSSSTCPVLKFGSYTYWAYSDINNGSTMAIVAYNAAGAIAQQWNRNGDRYIWQITVNTSAQTVSFAGQADSPIVFTWAELQLPEQPSDTTPPALSLPPGVTANATGPSGAAVAFTATATDTAPANPAVTCTPASGSTFAIGTTTVNCSATDAAGNTGTGSFTVTVKGAAAQLTDLQTAVTGAGPNNSLVPLVQQSQQQAQAGRTIVACGLLRGFLIQVDVYGLTGLISSAQAQQFTADANRIRAVLGCG